MDPASQVGIHAESARLAVETYTGPNELVRYNQEGYADLPGLFSPNILGRSLTLNPLVIILSLLFWGWLWGPVGALLAVPILVIAKTVCEHVERLQKLADFISGERPRAEQI